MAANVVLGSDPRVAETTPVSSEPEVVELDDEVGEIPLVYFGVGRAGAVADGRSPDGREVRHASCMRCWRRPTRSPRIWQAELEAQIREHSVWWPVDVPAAELAAAMVPMHDTPLGPLAPGLTLRQIGLADRLRELDFEFPLWPAATSAQLGWRAEISTSATSAGCSASTWPQMIRWPPTPTG